MRHFGTDKPEMMSFTLAGSDKVHALPLGTSLPFRLRIQMQEAFSEPDEMTRELLVERWQRDFLTLYLGEDTVASMTMADVQEVYQAWLEESSAVGAEAGE